jgi:RNA polymerase sigma-70 factor (ECF subfamily)
MTDGTDDELMARAGRGDRAAFGALVARHAARAASIAMRVSGNRSDAEEIVQEAFLRAWQKAPEWQARTDRADGAALSTWLYRVVVNLCLDRRRRPAWDGIDAAGEVADPAPSAFAAVARDQAARRVAAAVAALPDRQRAALTLCHYENLSNAEAAAILEVSVGAVESLLVRARRELRARLDDLVEYEPTGA